jgi:hypothetical protein
MDLQVSRHFTPGHHFDWPRIVRGLLGGSTLTFHLTPLGPGDLEDARLYHGLATRPNLRLTAFDGGNAMQ